MILNPIEQELWAKVYAAEFGRLSARVAAMVDKPDPNESTNWQYGSAVAGDACGRQAEQRADFAVKQLRDRSRAG